MTTIAITANVYNDALALPGWLESATAFADEVCVYHTGPGGKWSDDGTIEILEKWKVPFTFGDINEGFGEVRTKAVRLCSSDWVMVLDADERFMQFVPVLSCDGVSLVPPVHRQVLQDYDGQSEEACPWNWENVHNLNPTIEVTAGKPYDQGAKLRSMIANEPGLDAVVSTRRQWRDMTLLKPSQNWVTQPDYQTRIVRNSPDIFWRNKMHETLIGVKKSISPAMMLDIFFEHHHLWFKGTNPAQRAKDIETYRNIFNAVKL